MTSVPTGAWIDTQIKYVATVTLGKMLQTEETGPGDVLAPYLRAASVRQDGRVDLSTANEMWFTPPEIESLSLKRDDILVVEGGDVGRLAFLEQDLVGWGFQNSLNRLRANERTHPRFLLYLMEHARSSGFVRSFCNVVSFPHFTAEKVAAMPVTVPVQLQVQREIACFLDEETAAIDDLVKLQEALVRRLRERRSAVIDTVIWSGLDYGASMSGTGIDTAPLAPTHWQRLRNKNIYSERLDLSETGVEEMLTVSHITGITPRSEKNVTMFEAESNEGYRLVDCGDLVINTMWAWMGALGVSDHNGIVSPAYGVYAPYGRILHDPRFLNYLYRTTAYVAEITRYSTGIRSNRLRLYPEVFLRLPAVLPPIDEQRRIADHLDGATEKIDELIAKSLDHRALAKERRAALISDTVTASVSTSSHGAARHA